MRVKSVGKRKSRRGPRGVQACPGAPTRSPSEVPAGRRPPATQAERAVASVPVRCDGPMFRFEGRKAPRMRAFLRRPEGRENGAPVRGASLHAECKTKTPSACDSKLVLQPNWNRTTGRLVRISLYNANAALPRDLEQLGREDLKKLAVDLPRPGCTARCREAAQPCRVEIQQSCKSATPILM